MGFSYAQFGSGFGVARPSSAALRFAAWAERRGREATLTSRVRRGDAGGEPVYWEDSWGIRVFCVEDPRRVETTAGEVPGGSARFYAAAWAPIRAGDTIALAGVAYHVEAVAGEEACLRVEASRRVDS